MRCSALTLCLLACWVRLLQGQQCLEGEQCDPPEPPTSLCTRLPVHLRGDRSKVASWSNTDVSYWLSQIVGLPEYRAVFSEQNIDGTMLTDGLNDDELRNFLGVNKLDHRNRILSAISDLERIHLCKLHNMGQPGTADDPAYASPVIRRGTAEYDSVRAIDPQLYNQGLETVADHLALGTHGRHVNMFKVAIIKLMHDAGMQTIWPQLAPLTEVQPEIQVNVLKYGISKALRERTALHRRMSKLPPDRFPMLGWTVNSKERHVASNPDPGVLGSLMGATGTRQQMFETPGSPVWVQLQSLTRALGKWLRQFPVDNAALVWQSRVALALADFKTMISALQSLYGVARETARDVCRLRPTKLLKDALGQKLSGGQQVNIVSDECNAAGEYVQKVAADWSDAIALEDVTLRNGPPTVDKQIEAMQKLTQSYKDRHSFHQWLKGPGTSKVNNGLSWPPYASKAGLLHSEHQLEYLSELMLSTPLCGSQDPALQEDIATATTLQARFGSDCRTVAEELSEMSRAFALSREKSIKVLDRTKGNLTDDVLLLPAEEIRRLQPYIQRDLLLDPSGGRIEGPLLGSPPGAPEWQSYDHELDDEVLVIDNVFSKEALARLLRFSQRSTVFHHLKAKGYSCGLSGTGFSPALVAQAYSALHAALPTMLCKHRLFTAWAYVYGETGEGFDPAAADEATKDTAQWVEGSGIGAHADQAAVNINCWLTPDESRESPEYGGMKVWPIRPPKSWGPNEYNPNNQFSFHHIADGKYYDTQNRGDQTKVEEFVSSHSPKIVPYKQNRCVIFDSRFLHATHMVDFKKGFTNRRINLTFLVGHHGDTCAAAEARANSGLEANREHAVHKEHDIFFE